MTRPSAVDFLLPLALITAVGIMIFPLPKGVLDVMLLANIALALALLINSVFVSEPEKFTALPTILLLATLFRLSVNISTTRQLLGTGEAPDIIIAFGEFVVEGNMIVGLVVFSIITLVQFIVIAKGAERVAEVSARFTLDAMPGRQMSIDADLRSGILTMQEARQKRIDLQRESKLYGSLDGAMKFVKGDAIAGLLITIINITAGLVVGVLQQHLSFAQAAHKYTIFTIGDGLVSQIPALLVAVAAGVSVTQVSGQGSSYLSRDVFSQLVRDPRVLAITGVVLLVLASVPGFPLLPFLAAGVLLIGMAGRKSRRDKSAHSQPLEVQFRPKIYSGLVLRLSPSAKATLQAEQMLPRLISQMRSEFFERHGVLVPDLQFDVDERGIGLKTELFVHGEFRRALKTAQTAATPATAYSDVVISFVRQYIEENLPSFVDDTHTRTLLELHQGRCEDLVNSIVPQHLTITSLTMVLRSLIDEQVSIRDLRTILQALAEHFLVPRERKAIPSAAGGAARQISALYGNSQYVTKSQLDLLSIVRVALGSVITLRLADGSNQVAVWLLAPELDQLICEHQAGDVAIAPNLISALLDEIREKRKADGEGTTIVITSGSSRGVLAGIIHPELREVAVVSIEELSDEAGLHVKGEVRVSNLDVSEFQTNNEVMAG